MALREGVSRVGGMVVGFAVVIALAMASCITDSTTECLTSNGPVRCGVGKVCLASGFGCASPGQVDACQRLADGDPCVAADAQVAAGRCHAGACRAVICGDGDMSYGEVCDDGNLNSGDGCSSNCASTEVCGNGVLDPAEGCDDGNQTEGDDCQPNCKVPKCGDGIVDVGRGEACDDGNREGNDGCSASCISTERCGNGIIDVALGEQCDDGNAEPLDGCHNDCAIPRCGDGVLDTHRQEACDDGNNLALDGCSADCLSNNTCGNGIVDAALGETCDSGLPGLAGDGCSSTCRAETSIWQELQLRRVPTTERAPIAYDASRGVVVMLAPGELGLETWEFDDVQWQLRDDVGSPPFNGGGMTYDSLRKVIWYVVGGKTYRYNGRQWEVTGIIGAPGGVTPRNMAFDQARQRVVVVDANHPYEFDGVAWSQRPSLPFSGSNSLVAYDASRNVVVVVRPLSASTTSVYEYNGSWVNKGTHNQNAEGGSLVFDLRSQQVMLFSRAANAQQLATWGGTQFQPVMTYGIFASSQNVAGTPHGVVTVGGRYAVTNAKREVTEIVRDLQLVNLVEPSPSAEHVAFPPLSAILAYDQNGLWILRNRRWQRLPASNAPPFRLRPQLAYHPGLRKLVMFGGTSHEYQGDTWLFDGKGWQSFTAGPSPVARDGAAFVYDPNRGQLLLFGGSGPYAWGLYPLVGNEVWGFDATGWTKLAFNTAFTTPCAVPSVCVAAFDEVLKAVTVYLPHERRAWQLGPLGWTERTMLNAPSARNYPAFGFDPLRRRLVLVGGIVANAVSNDTWELDGLQWSKRVSQLAPPRELMQLHATPGAGLTAFVQGSNPSVWQYFYQNLDEPPDRCQAIGLDSDGDGRTLCGALPDDPLTDVNESLFIADPDCWAICTPDCPPSTTALDVATMSTVAWPAACELLGRPRCGDGTCSEVESAMVCPQDCAAPRCGDGLVTRWLGERCDDGNQVDGDGCDANCQPGLCGNGQLDVGERCDDGPANGGNGACAASCDALCGDGIMEGSEQCDDGNRDDNDACTSTCELPRCGDGVLSSNEFCDDGNQQADDGCGPSCAACGNGRFDPGELCDDGNTQDGDNCLPGCILPRCNDGQLDPFEQCDDGNANDMDSCNSTCQPPTCGNGTIEGSERCDDGNSDDYDSCHNNCTPSCPDGYTSGIEECDDGNTDDTDNCRSNCTVIRCGDGVVDTFLGEQCEGEDASCSGCQWRCGNGSLDSGEQCDDGNRDDNDACPSNCQYADYCGDGQPTGNEACDDGASNSNEPNASCRTDCTSRRCGDSVVDFAYGEICDDGNATSGDGCDACQVPNVCGNSSIEATEQCDDGGSNSNSPNAPCRTDCTPRRCGDAIVDDQFGETCDDGNTVGGDGCESSCYAPVCGDGSLQSGEQCDDGLSNSDAPNANCRPSCVLQYCGDGITDDLRGETCDDGNATNGDGCEGNCAPTP